MRPRAAWVRKAVATSRAWRRSRPSNGSSMSRAGCGVRRPIAEQGALALALRECADGLVQQRREIELFDDFREQCGAASEKPDGEIESPPHRLGGPRRDAVWKIEQK